MIFRYRHFLELRDTKVWAKNHINKFTIKGLLSNEANERRNTIIARRFLYNRYLN